MAAPSPEPRRISTPSWLDLRLVLGVTLVLVSVLVGATVVSRASDTRAAIAAGRDLAPGTILHADDLRTRQVQLPDGEADVYLSEMSDAVGKTLDRAVAKDELLPAAAVARVTPRTRLTVPFASGTAPRLHAGERIEVWVSTKTCASVVLLPDVTVQDVRSDTSGSFTNGTGGQDVTVTVEPGQDLRVVAALGIDGAEIRAGVLIGDRSSRASPAPTSGASPTSGSLPDDLAACAGPSTGR